MLAVGKSQKGSGHNFDWVIGFDSSTQQKSRNTICRLSCPLLVAAFMGSRFSVGRVERRSVPLA